MLDGLRFAAALGVAFFHFTAKQHQAWGRPVPEVFPHLHTFTSLGYYGVHLFFVISGFVILMTAWGKDIPSFVASRISRLYPAYLVAVPTAAVLLGVIWLEQKHITIYQVAVNLTMMQGAFGVDHIDGVYWTLWVELRFYVLIALFMLVGITRQRVLAFAAVWPVAAALARTTNQQWLAEALNADYAALFAGGMAIYLLTRHHRDVAAWLVLAMSALLAVAVPGQESQATLASSTGVSFSGHTTALVILCCFGAVAVVTLTPLARVHIGWLTGLGLLTYPLYLVHEWWGWWMIHLLSGKLPNSLVLAITFAFVGAFAALVYFFVERPFAPRVRTVVEKSLRELSTRR
ncbi:acyltransferase [Curtobacterium sp. MCPF17_002]|uniref:acyltransferase family protein n=1 Tax=Curtobacterium sp. MCPF17_002 TaxID=2175645 RepID=UPI000DA73B9B|nr:acyltransferase [Curtobacterium sp. MCPF17_002]WIB78902.1 acyltransferase [Curtobacterium sp. MCPF17_002]